jgi:hypothetical protein
MGTIWEPDWPCNSNLTTMQLNGDFAVTLEIFVSYNLNTMHFQCRRYMVELASGASSRKGVQVQLLSSASHFFAITYANLVS